MPRNAKENIYVTLGFARRSPTWQRLQSEATELGVSVPHLIKVLLADRAAALEGYGKHLWFPREMHPIQAPSATLPSSPGSKPAAEYDPSWRATAAAAAASYWED